MSVITLPPPITPPVTNRLPAEPVPDEPVYRLTVDEYHGMISYGVFNDDDAIELLEGILVQKVPEHPPHTLTKILIRDALAAILPAGWHARAETTITTADSEPLPDGSVVRGTVRNYGNRHPGPEDSSIVIEVSDSTLRRDRGRKKRIYARANVPVYWVVNLVDRQVEVYTAPSGPGAAEPDYAQSATYGPDAELPVVIDGNEVGRLTVRDLLP